MIASSSIDHGTSPRIRADTDPCERPSARAAGTWRSRALAISARTAAATACEYAGLAGAAVVVMPALYRQIR